MTFSNYYIDDVYVQCFPNFYNTRLKEELLF